MKISDFGVEMWLNENENDCAYNLSETCAAALLTNELLELTGKKDEYLSKLLALKLDYGDITGSERLKHEISRLYGQSFEGKITAAHGGIGANSLVFLSLIEPGDHVISVVPTYQQLYSMPQAMGAHVDIIRLSEENGWQIDPQELEALVTDKTKLICLNNPNNPTGTLIPTEVLGRIAETARRHNAYLLCDEAYRGLSYEGNFLQPSVVDIYERGIATGSMSKAFSMAGVRFGWIAGPAEVIDDINRHRDYHVISIGKIDDFLACIALENRDLILDRNRRLCRENLSVISEWVDSESRLSFVKPRSGTTCFIKFDFDIDSVTLCTRLLKEAGTLLVPGRYFEFDNHFRLGFGNDRKTIKNGIQSISGWMRKNGYQ